MVFGIDDALIAAGISAAGATAGGYLSGRSNQPKETKLQKQQRHLTDDLIASLKGNGSYNDLFDSSNEAFQKSFVDPAKHIFNSQIAPQIQQNAIYNGTQRSTSLDDTLTRAGVDLDQLLNQRFANFQQQGLNRQQNTISNILGQQGGVQPSMGNSDILGNSLSGYLNSDSFSNSVQDIFNPKNNQVSKPPRKGFERDWNQAAAYAASAPNGG